MEQQKAMVGDVDRADDPAGVFEHAVGLVTGYAPSLHATPSTERAASLPGDVGAAQRWLVKLQQSPDIFFVLDRYLSAAPSDVAAAPQRFLTGFFMAAQGAVAFLRKRMLPESVGDHNSLVDALMRASVGLRIAQPSSNIYQQLVLAAALALLRHVEEGLTTALVSLLEHMQSQQDDFAAILGDDDDDSERVLLTVQCVWLDVVGLLPLESTRKAFSVASPVRHRIKNELRSFSDEAAPRIASVLETSLAGEPILCLSAVSCASAWIEGGFWGAATATGPLELLLLWLDATATRAAVDGLHNDLNAVEVQHCGEGLLAVEDGSLQLFAQVVATVTTALEAYATEDFVTWASPFLLQLTKHNATHIISISKILRAFLCSAKLTLFQTESWSALLDVALQCVQEPQHPLVLDEALLLWSSLPSIYKDDENVLSELVPYFESVLGTIVFHGQLRHFGYDEQADSASQPPDDRQDAIRGQREAVRDCIRACVFEVPTLEAWFAVNISDAVNKHLAAAIQDYHERTATSSHSLSSPSSVETSSYSNCESIFKLEALLHAASAVAKRIFVAGRSAAGHVQEALYQLISDCCSVPPHPILLSIVALLLGSVVAYLPADLLDAASACVARGLLYHETEGEFPMRYNEDHVSVVCLLKLSRTCPTTSHFQQLQQAYYSDGMRACLCRRSLLLLLEAMCTALNDTAVTKSLTEDATLGPFINSFFVDARDSVVSGSHDAADAKPSAWKSLEVLTKAVKEGTAARVLLHVWMHHLQTATALALAVGDGDGDAHAAIANIGLGSCEPLCTTLLSAASRLDDGHRHSQLRLAESLNSLHTCVKALVLSPSLFSVGIAAACCAMVLAFRPTVCVRSEADTVASILCRCNDAGIPIADTRTIEACAHSTLTVALDDVLAFSSCGNLQEASEATACIVAACAESTLQYHAHFITDGTEKELCDYLPFCSQVVEVMPWVAVTSGELQTILSLYFHEPVCNPDIVVSTRSVVRALCGFAEAVAKAIVPLNAVDSLGISYPPAMVTDGQSISGGDLSGIPLLFVLNRCDEMDALAACGSIINTTFIAIKGGLPSWALNDAVSILRGCITSWGAPVATDALQHAMGQDDFASDSSDAAKAKFLEDFARFSERRDWRKVKNAVKMFCGGKKKATAGMPPRQQHKGPLL